jgi:hypothetical protein
MQSPEKKIHPLFMIGNFFETGYLDKCLKKVDEDLEA